MAAAAHLQKSQARCRSVHVSGLTLYLGHLRISSGYARESIRWTSRNRTSPSLLRVRVLRNRWRSREPRPRLRVAWESRTLLASWAAAVHAFIDPERCLGHEPRRNRGDPYVVHSWVCGRRTCESKSPSASSVPRRVSEPGSQLALACPSQLRNPARRRVGSLFSLCCCPLFQTKQGSRNLSARSSPQLAPVILQGGVGSRCHPSRAVVRDVTATKHEPGLSPLHRVVSYGSALEVLGPPDQTGSLSVPACTRQNICRGAALVSRLDSLAFSSDMRGRSKALIFAVFIGTSVTDSEPVNFFGRPRELGLRTKYFKDDPEGLQHQLHQALRSRCSCAIARLVSGTRGARLLRD